MKTLNIALVFLVLMISGCDLFGPETKDQKYLFDAFYVNYAWGFSLHGSYIDINGNVYSYQVKPADMTDPDSLRMIRMFGKNLKETELDYKYHFNKKFIKNINPVIARRKLSDIYDVPLNANSDTTSEGADMGVFVYSCYRYNTHNDSYDIVVLKVNGDFSFYNKSKTAVDLVNWMKTEL